MYEQYDECKLFLLFTLVSVVGVLSSSGIAATIAAKPISIQYKTFRGSNYLYQFKIVLSVMV